MDALLVTGNRNKLAALFDRACVTAISFKN